MKFITAIRRTFPELNNDLFDAQLIILGNRFEKFCRSNRHIKPKIKSDILREILLQKIKLDPAFAQDLLDPTKNIFLDFENTVENNRKITITLSF